NQYPLQAPQGRNEFAQPTRTNQALYDQQRAAIDKKYNDQIEHLNSAAFNVAAVKSFNQEVSKGTDPADVNPYTIGVNMRYGLGDKLELGLIDNKDIDPSVKVATELMGYRALDVMKAKAFADGDLPLAKSLEEKTKNATQKVIDNNPEFRKQQVQKALSDKIFENGNSLWESIAGKNVTQGDVQKAGEELGLRPQDYADIKPEDIKRWSGAVNTGINSFIREGIAPIVEAEGRHILNPIANMIGSGYSNRQLNDLYGKEWYDNSSIGRFFEGAAPDNAGLINQGTKVESNPLSQNYLLNVSNDNDSKWNIGLVPILNTIANGTGQTVAFGAGGEVTGSLIRGARLISDAEKATRVGMNAYMWLTGWDRNYKQAAEAVGNNPEDEAKRIGLAAIYNASEVASENIIPDYKITRGILGTNAVSSFLDKFKREGVSAVTKDGVKNAFKEGMLEAGKNIIGEGLEESATDYGQMVGDMIYAPDKFAKNDYNQQALQDGVVGAVSAFLPVGAGAVRGIAQHGPMAKSMIYEVGNNPVYYTEQFRKKIEDGTISQQEGNEKIKLVNTLSDIVSKSVPETSIVNNQDLTAKQKHDYANLRLQEEILRSQKETVKDPVQEKYID
ncbi:MAG TPA: hypothetical protein VFS31_11200, partial [Chitinophagaceae bacterium]|nr:hypothetical protein [Chitinophagaceae bacterium]